MPGALDLELSQIFFNPSCHEWNPSWSRYSDVQLVNESKEIVLRLPITSCQTLTNTHVHTPLRLRPIIRAITSQLFDLDTYVYRSNDFNFVLFVLSEVPVIQFFFILTAIGVPRITSSKHVWDRFAIPAIPNLFFFN